VVISDDGDFHCIFDLLCAGASGYLLRGTSAVGLCDAVRQVAEGGAPMSPQIARKVIEFFHHRGADPTRALTPREREIVSGLVDGLSYKQIADRMHITVETVRSHIKSIYHKLHVHGKAELIARTLRGEL
jgi:DNA-binding NarL/FixJ family response regulator